MASLYYSIPLSSIFKPHVHLTLNKDPTDASTMKDIEDGSAYTVGDNDYNSGSADEFVVSDLRMKPMVPSGYSSKSNGSSWVSKPIVYPEIRVIEDGDDKEDREDRVDRVNRVDRVDRVDRGSRDKKGGMVMSVEAGMEGIEEEEGIEEIYTSLSKTLIVHESKLTPILYPTVYATIVITVVRKKIKTLPPTLIWPRPANIDYGMELSTGGQLNAKLVYSGDIGGIRGIGGIGGSMVPDTVYAYTCNGEAILAGIVLPAGKHTLEVMANIASTSRGTGGIGGIGIIGSKGLKGDIEDIGGTPIGGMAYTASVRLTIRRIEQPVIIWPPDIRVGYGTRISSELLYEVCYKS